MTDTQLNLAIPISESVKFKGIIKRSGQVVAFDPEKITNAIYRAAVSIGGKDRDLSEKLSRKVLKALSEIYPADSVINVEEIQDWVERILIENNHAKTAKAFILYRAEQRKKRENKEALLNVEDNIPYRLIWRSYSWNVDHSADSIEKLNLQMKDGRWRDLVIASEKKYHDDVKKVAKQILKRKDEIRVLIVAGPSSSGKTTTTIKIGEELEREGLSFRTLNIDHYFRNLDQHPRDEFGDYDYEKPEALELDMINTHLEALLKGKKIWMPRYDFKQGKRFDNETEMKLNPGEIILIDSLHGLYEPMTQSVLREQKFRFYIEALCQIKDMRGEFIRWTDLRMMRRMIRDSLFRNSDPLQTIGHWHYVRRSEKQYIVPYIKTADAVFNGSLSYEIAVHKVYLETWIAQIVRHFEEHPHQADALLRARRLQKILASITRFPDTNFIPRHSFLREFIGGSVYKY